MGDYLFRKTLQKSNHQPWSLGCVWILNVIFIDERRRLNRPRAQRSGSVGGGGQANINHVSSVPLPFGALGRFGVRLLQEHPLQRSNGGWGFCTKVNNSPCPEGSTNNIPSITRVKKERGWEPRQEKKQQTFIYCHWCHFRGHFFSWFMTDSDSGLRWIDWVRWIGWKATKDKILLDTKTHKWIIETWISLTKWETTFRKKLLALGCKKKPKQNKTKLLKYIMSHDVLTRITLKVKLQMLHLTSLQSWKVIPEFNLALVRK